MNLYVVRSQDGKFFRAIGYGGHGENWVDSIEKAKFYPKIGGAKGRVTYFTKNYPEYGTPDILEFTLEVAQAKVLNMVEYATKRITSIKKAELERERQRNEYELKCLQSEQERIKGRIKKLST